MPEPTQTPTPAEAQPGAEPETVCSMPRFMSCDCGHIDGCQYPVADDEQDTP